MYRETDVIKIASNDEGDILTMTVITGNGKDQCPGVKRLRVRVTLMRAPVTAKYIQNGVRADPRPNRTD